MNLDRLLRDQLKDMPHIQPKTDRERVRRHVLSEVAKREQRAKQPRQWRLLLPVVFAGAMGVFMFMIVSPWVTEMVQDGRNEKSTSRSSNSTLMSTLDKGDSDEASPDANSESHQVPPPNHEEKEEGHAKGDPTSDEGKSDANAQEDKPATTSTDEPKPSKTEEAQTKGKAIDYAGQVRKTLALEGTPEEMIFDRYIFRPYGLQILIPVMADGEKWYSEQPRIEGDSDNTVVFMSKSGKMANGRFLLGDISVDVYEQRPFTEVKQEKLDLFGDGAEFKEKKASNGERLLFYRKLKDQQGESYDVVQEVFLTEQDEKIFAFNIERNTVTSEGWEPRLIQVVYPELKVIE